LLETIKENTRLIREAKEEIQKLYHSDERAWAAAAAAAAKQQNWTSTCYMDIFRDIIYIILLRCPSDLSSTSSALETSDKLGEKNMCAARLLFNHHPPFLH
jgi:hypothetical protein